MFTVKIDLTNGNITNLVENFIYTGSSLTFDGISAFDPRRLVFYYATDSDNAYVFEADLKNAKLLPPIDFYSRGILNLNYDTNKDRLLVSMFDAKLNPILASFPQDGPFSIVLQYPTNPHFARAAIDSGKQLFYWTSYRVVNNTFAYRYLSKIPLDNPNQITSVQLKCPLPDGQVVWPQKMIWDSAKRQLFSIGVSFRGQVLRYWIEKMDMSGNCQQISLQLSMQGIVTAYTYDQMTSTLYYALATNGGGYVFEADINSGKLKGNGVHVGMQLVPESIEFAYT